MLEEGICTDTEPDIEIVMEDIIVDDLELVNMVFDMLIIVDEEVVGLDEVRPPDVVALLMLVGDMGAA